MHERMKLLRTAMRLSQDAFAGRIGVSGNFVYLVEKGERQLSERTQKDICRVFHVRPEWLCYGRGEMFAADDGDDLMEAFKRVYDRMDVDGRKALKRALVDIAKELSVCGE